MYQCKKATALRVQLLVLLIRQCFSATKESVPVELLTDQPRRRFVLTTPEEPQRNGATSSWQAV